VPPPPTAQGLPNQCHWGQQWQRHALRKASEANQGRDGQVAAARGVHSGAGCGSCWACRSTDRPAIDRRPEGPVGSNQAGSTRSNGRSTRSNRSNPGRSTFLGIQAKPERSKRCTLRIHSISSDIVPSEHAGTTPVTLGDVFVVKIHHGPRPFPPSKFAAGPTHPSHNSSARALFSLNGLRSALGTMYDCLGTRVGLVSMQKRT
jgi:hypothetical protein